MSSLHLELATDAIRNTDSGSDSGRAKKMGGWLAAFAAAMGKLLNQQAAGVQDFANTLGKDPLPSDTTELQMRTQMFSMLMSAVDNAIKTQGQAGEKASSKN